MSTEVESVSIPVIEEELKLDRESVETGRVRVRTVPEEHTEKITESLLRTDVLIERVPKDERIDAIPPVREEGDTVVVSVVEERLVKKLFLVEEVRLSRRASNQDIEQPVKLRSQHVVVEREESSGEPHQQE
jgi:stress response protein YsnF